MPNGLLNPNSDAYRLLHEAAREARVVVFCGIPGVGKSLLLREQVRIADGAGRKVSLLQWDVSRQAFERPDILQQYPEVGGSTHVMVRRAVGLWSRAAVAEWLQVHPDGKDLLVIEAPLVGGRLIELAQRSEDRAEAPLCGPDVRFYIPTPTVKVREAIEAARRSESVAPRHGRDSANAIPTVVEELWRMVAHAARQLRLHESDLRSAYSPEVYAGVYRAVLRYRVASELSVDEVFSLRDSPHDLEVQVSELVPDNDEVLRLISQAEHEGHEAVSGRAETWYVT